MPWADGTFSRTRDWTDDAGAGLNMEATYFDQEDDNFESGINDCINKNGQNSPTVDLPMNAKKHTNVDNASARNQYAAAGQIQDGALVHGTCGGSSNAYTLTLIPAITAYTAGQCFGFIANHTNDGAATMNVNGVGAKNIHGVSGALVSAEIVSGEPYLIYYDGTQFVLFAPHRKIIRSREVFTANGTFTAPDHCYQVWVECWGGGGGAGGSGGGQGGAYAAKLVAVTPGTGYAIVIGAGGVGSGTPTAGGSTTFASTTVVATGGNPNNGTPNGAGAVGDIVFYSGYGPWIDQNADTQQAGSPAANGPAEFRVDQPPAANSGHGGGLNVTGPTYNNGASGLCIVHYVGLAL